MSPCKSFDPRWPPRPLDAVPRRRPRHPDNYDNARLAQQRSAERAAENAARLAAADLAEKAERRAKTAVAHSLCRFDIDPRRGSELVARPRAGWFIPDWVVWATKTETRAMVLCALNSRYSKRWDRELTRCGRLVFAEVRLGMLVSQLCLPRQTVKEALAWLVDRDWVVPVRAGPRHPPGYALRPRPITTAIFQALDQRKLRLPDKVELWPPEKVSEEDWMGCPNRIAAFRRAPGITVHRALRGICGKSLGLARLLSQVLYRCQAESYRGWRLTMPELAAALNCTERTAQRLVKRLKALGFLRVEYATARRGGQERKICFLLPCYQTILEALQALRQQDTANSPGPDAPDDYPEPRAYGVEI